MAYGVGDVIVVNDRMQKGYSYSVEEAEGKNFAQDFKPHFSPEEMLKMGVFEGKYCNDCRDELPGEWFVDAKVVGADDPADPSLNHFRVKSRQSLNVWQEKGWIVGDDPRGWFQWYCRYYLGRRVKDVDEWQIKRWKAFARHAGQIKANCRKGDLDCRPKQRQALLQWSYDPFI